MRMRASKGAEGFPLSRFFWLLGIDARHGAGSGQGCGFGRAAKAAWALTRLGFNTLLLCGACRDFGLHRMASLGVGVHGAGQGAVVAASTGRAGAGGAAASTDSPHYFGGCASGCLCHHG